MTDDLQFRFGLVAFFGRSIEEYVTMFNLNLEEMRGTTVLDCPAGPSAFARQAPEFGISVVACDPMFGEGVEKLRAIVDKDAQAVTEKQAAHRELFHKELTPTSERRKAMDLFLQDYALKPPLRYLAASLPELPFETSSFEIVLSGNFLFLYSDPASGGMMENSPFDLTFHKQALAALIRVCAKEVRIYPLQGPHVREHSYLPPVIEACQSAGLHAEVQAVKQRDIVGAEKMLLIRR